ncbi:pilin [Patescibacteria group bacterium]|nr:pilin [Patescibacteria group bacterium]MBU1683498.1 pilin [Patescibacteria group bacterium]
MIKKLSASLGAATLFANNAFAQSAAFFDNPQTGTAPNVAAQGTLGQNITTMINFFLGLLGLIAVGFLIYAGVMMVTAGGNEEQVTKAKKIITWALIGIVLILLSYTIVQFVTSALG